MIVKRCSKILLYIVNVISILLGIATVILAKALEMGKLTAWSNLIQLYVNEALAKLKYKSNFVFNEAMVVRFTTRFGFDMTTLQKLTIGLFILGIFMVIMGLIAIVGMYCRINALMWCYIIILFVIMSALIALIVLINVAKFNFRLMSEQQIKDIASRRYEGPSSNTISTVIDVLQVKLGCCGSISYKDYGNRKQVFDNPSDIMPSSCCKIVNSTLGPPSGCASSANDTKNNGNIGCNTYIWDEIINKKWWLVNCALLAPALLCSVIQLAAIHLLKHETDKET